MSTYPLPPDEQPQPPEPQPDERSQDDEWQPYRPTPLPAPVFPRPGPLDQPSGQPGQPGQRPPPGHHIPQHDDRRPYAAPPQQPPPQPPHEGPPPFPGPFAPGPGHHIPYGAPPSPPPPPAFAPPVDGPLPPPPAFAPPVSGPQPPPPQPGLLPPQVQPQFQPPYEPRRPEPPRQPAAETAADLPPVRPGLRRRRLIELGALLLLAPVVVGVRWYDDSNHAVTQDPPERVTVVARGAWAKLGHTQWRLLGRQDRPTPTGDPDTPPGAATLVLLLQAKVLDARGVKELSQMDYVIHDRAGHIWSAEGAVESQSLDEDKPTPGSTQRVKVIATVPRSKLSEVVLDLHIQANVRPERTVLDVLRFAH